MTTAPALIAETTEATAAHLYVVPKRQVARGRHVPAGRTLHLADIENLMAGPASGLRAMSDAADQYRLVAAPTEHDAWIVAANPGLGPWLSDVFPSARVRIGYGENGADLALLSAAGNAQFVTERFDRVVIGSGDAIFVRLVTSLRELGIPVEVVSRPESLSNRLAEAATVVRLLDGIETGRVA